MVTIGARFFFVRRFGCSVCFIGFTTLLVFIIVVFGYSSVFVICGGGFLAIVVVIGFRVWVGVSRGVSGSVGLGWVI